MSGKRTRQPTSRAPMKLEIISNPRITDSTRVSNYIDVTYDSIKDRTTIEIDCDLVTLGVAVEVLKQKYDEFLASLEPGTAVYVQSCIKEAIHGQN